MLTAEVYSFTIRIGGIDVHIVFLRTCVLYMHEFTEFEVTIYTGSVWYDTIQFEMVLYTTVWNGIVQYGLEWYGTVRFGMVWYGTSDVTAYTA